MRPRPATGPRLAALAVPALILLAATACGDDGGDTADGAAGGGPGTTVTTTTVPAPPAALNEATEPVVVGHRGAAGHHPDNSLEGLAAARALGATWVEIDVRLTADDEVVLAHDPETAAGTEVAAATAADLAEEGVPTLADAMAVADAGALGVDVELKALPWEDGYDESLALVDATLAVLDDGPAVGPVLISSFNRDALDRVRDRAGDRYDTVLIQPGGADPPTPEDLAARGHDGLALEGPDIPAATVAPFADAGLAVWAWTIDDPDEARALVAAGVTGIITDLPDVISEALSG